MYFDIKSYLSILTMFVGLGLIYTDVYSLTNNTIFVGIPIFLIGVVLFAKSISGFRSIL
jgi:hypothetical protein